MKNTAPQLWQVTVGCFDMARQCLDLAPGGLWLPSGVLSHRWRQHLHKSNAAHHWYRLKDFSVQICTIPHAARKHSVVHSLNWFELVQTWFSFSCPSLNRGPNHKSATLNWTEPEPELAVQSNSLGFELDSEPNSSHTILNGIVSDQLVISYWYWTELSITSNA